MASVTASAQAAETSGSEQPTSPRRDDVKGSGAGPVVSAGDGGAHYLFVPGRVCLFGEHSDWAGGFRRFNQDIHPGCTLVVGTNQGLHAEAKHPV